MKTTTLERNELDAAVETLLRGYEEETSLYSVVRNLTRNQRVTLRDERDVPRFSDLHDEKEDILQLIEQIEDEMKSAKSVVMARHPDRCPRSLRLTRLLDNLTQLIEEIRILESANAALLGGTEGKSVALASQG